MGPARPNLGWGVVPFFRLYPLSPHSLTGEETAAILAFHERPGIWPRLKARVARALFPAAYGVGALRLGRQPEALADKKSMQGTACAGVGKLKACRLVLNLQDGEALRNLFVVSYNLLSGGSLKQK